MCTKSRFATEQFAIDFIAKLKKTSKTKVIPQKTYLCKECNTWHLSSLPEKFISKKLHDIEITELTTKISNQTMELTNLQKKLENQRTIVSSLRKLIAQYQGKEN